MTKRQVLVGVACCITLVLISVMGFYFWNTSKVPTEVGQALSVLEKVQSKSRYYNMIVDSVNEYYVMENKNGVSVSQLNDGGIKIKGSKHKAFIFVSDMMLESTDASPHRLARNIMKIASKGKSSEMAVSPVENEELGEGLYQIEVQLKGLKKIEQALKTMSDEYAHDQMQIIDNILRINPEAEPAILFRMITDLKEVCYIELNYLIGTDQYSVWKIDGFKEISDWEPSTDWNKVDVNKLSNEEIAVMAQETVDIVDKIFSEQLSN